MDDPRLIRGNALQTALRRTRARTLAAAEDLSPEQWLVPYDPGIQPVAWDLAHIGWFAEFWMLRGAHGLASNGNIQAEREARFFVEDQHYDSARISHRGRWQIPLYERADLLARLADQLEACCDHLASCGDEDGDLYFARLALYHELMHHEGLLWTRNLLAYPEPEGYPMRRVTAAPPHRQPSGSYELGRRPGTPGFSFDNEEPGRSVELEAFSIDANPVTNGEFLHFVEADGYRREELWPGIAGEYLRSIERHHPTQWRRNDDGSYEHRRFDTWHPLPLDEPAVHISAYEAEAYCHFAGRRLPSAAEWEVAAEDISWGHSVWEWTADPLAPYPGFRPGPYTTYSAPWFHWQREMRGGAFATDALVHHRAYRNFFLPQRTDVFAGFRTVDDAS